MDVNSAMAETLHRLRFRREALGMSCAQLAQSSGLSLRTVQRVLSGEEQDPSLSTLSRMAAGLAMSLRLEEESADAVRRRQAERKAQRLVAMVQGTSGLEAQAVPEELLREMRARTVHELLAGSRRKLWEE